MTFEFQSHSFSRKTADLVVLFLHNDPAQRRRQQTVLRSTFGRDADAPLRSEDFSGNSGETALVYAGSRSVVRKILLVGLGDRASVTTEKYRRAAAVAAQRARTLHSTTVGFILPRLGGTASESITAFCEGAGLGLYKFSKYLTTKEKKEKEVEILRLFSTEPAVIRSAPAAMDRARAILAGVILARDLANEPSNEIYPETLAAAAQESAGRNGFSITVMGETEIKSLGMGGLLGVSQGSDRPPRFIVMEYGPKPRRPVVLVGKGVTFDTGGISIKPSAGMAEMKMDMSGAAAVIGTFETVSRLKLPVHLIGLIPAVENMPGGSAIKPGDILRHYNGKTSEIDNTDAEGRLILADALGYAETFKPAAVIDLATLTGAVVVALGHHATGMMGNNESLMRKLSSAGEATYERVWRLPFFEEYEKQIKSDIADVKNTGGRWAGAITAGLFLKKFIGAYAWVHLDIAGTAIIEESTDYVPRGGSGVGVRLLTEFLRRWK